MPHGVVETCTLGGVIVINVIIQALGPQAAISPYNMDRGLLFDQYGPIH